MTLKSLTGTRAAKLRTAQDKVGRQFDLNQTDNLVSKYAEGGAPN